MSSTTNASWCPYCAGKARCDQLDCHICAKSCDICKSKKAFTRTRVSRVQCCRSCYHDAVSRDPAEANLQSRAKVSIEICTLAELQRQAENDECYYVFTEFTSWDCPILPGLGFRPDVMFCFASDGSLIQNAGACKLDSGEIAFALQLEVIEECRKEHSRNRSIPDDERESQIRRLFESQHIPLGVVYATMAHERHIHAQAEDVFYRKAGEEYEVIEARREAWRLRIQAVLAALLSLSQERLNATIMIGN
jgi:hypothetical protein